MISAVAQRKYRQQTIIIRKYRGEKESNGNTEKSWTLQTLMIKTQHSLTNHYQYHRYLKSVQLQISR